MTTILALKEEALRLAEAGRTSDEVLQALTENLAGFDQEEKRQKLDLLSRTLADEPRWNLLTQEQTTAPRIQTEAQNGQPQRQTPPSLEESLRTMMEELRTFRERDQARETRMLQLEKENRALVENLQTPSVTPTFPVHAPRTFRIPDPEPFDGTRKDFRTFRAQMRYKMEQDAALLGSGVGYLFSRLKGDPAALGLSWQERHPYGTTAEFWAFLEDHYTDSLREEKARRKLQTMKQKNTPIQTFNSKFMEFAYDAGEEDSKDMLKTRYLSALRPDLMDRMVTVEIPSNWTLAQLMQRVVGIEENLFRAKMGRSFQNRKAPTEDAMDWQPTSALAGRPHKNEKGAPSKKKAAKWVSPQEFAKRKEKNLCLRCGKSGHHARSCELGPAEKPARVMATTSPASDEDDSDSDDSESEN